jgi:hypothetical protein
MRSAQTIPWDTATQTEVDRFIIQCITVPITGTLLAANFWAMLTWIHDLSVIHIFDNSIADCLHHHYSLMIYGTGFGMLFSCIFFKNGRRIIDSCVKIMHCNGSRESYSQLLVNMIMLQLASGFIDSSICLTIRNRYEKNNCDQLTSISGSQLFFVNHETLYQINLISMWIYFGILFIIFCAFFLESIRTLIRYIGSEAMLTIENPMDKIKYSMSHMIHRMNEIATKCFQVIGQR